MSQIRVPKAGLFRQGGKLNQPMHHLVATLTGRVENAPASNAAGVLSGDARLIQSQGLWDTMDPSVSQGSGIWKPDLSVALDFIRVVTGATTIGFPESIPGNARPFYSVLIVQSGGYPVTFADELFNEAPVIYDGAEDETLIGMKVRTRDPETFLAWSVVATEVSV